MLQGMSGEFQEGFGHLICPHLQLRHALQTYSWLIWGRPKFGDRGLANVMGSARLYRGMGSTANEEETNAGGGLV